MKHIETKYKIFLQEDYPTLQVLFTYFQAISVFLDLLTKDLSY